MMTIKDRDLQPGTRLVARYHKQQYTCEVVQREGDKLRYRLDDGREFKSPSAAGTAITGKACNGWVFWSVVETAEAASVVETKPEGQTRWYCRECGQSFIAPTGETPEACPQGHQIS
jgi:hypothetical protein